MSRKPLLILLLPLILSACAPETPSAIRYASIPLVPHTATEEKALADRIMADCGNPPACPYGSPDAWALEYVGVRQEIRAADQLPKAK